MGACPYSSRALSQARLQTQAGPSKSCGFLLRMAHTSARPNQDTAWPVPQQSRSLACSPPPLPRSYSGIRRGGPRGESARPARREQVPGASAGNRDEITFLLRDLGECDDNCPRRQATSWVTQGISAHNRAEPQVRGLCLQWPQPYPVSRPSPAVLRGAVENSMDRMWFFLEELP